MSSPSPLDTDLKWDSRFTRHHLDVWMLALLLCICALGIAILYSATGRSEDMVIGQLERFVLGMVMLAVLAQVPPEWMRLSAPWIYAGSLLLLAVVPVIGHSSKGAVRWLEFGPMRFQPSEVMKLGMPLAVSAFLHARPLPPGPFTTLGALMLIMVPTGLIAVEPDLGTAMLVLVSGLLALYFGGLLWRWILGAVAAGGALAPVLWFKLHDYQRERLMTFLDPSRDPLGAGYHITQSKIAIGSGGLFGKGWLLGTQAKLEFLPEAHTDFIFSVYSEELGLLGVLLLLALYLAIVGRGLVIALRGQDTFQRLLAASLSLTFFVYVIINMGMVIGLLPVVGVPLPLVSYGGTSMVTLLAGFGLIMSVHSHRKLLSN